MLNHKDPLGLENFVYAIEFLCASHLPNETLCIAQGQESGIQATHNNGKNVLLAMCVDAGYKAKLESSDSITTDNPGCRMRTDVVVYIDGVSVDDLDYGVTDPSKGYLGSENWTKLELTTPVVLTTCVNHPPY